MMLRCQMENKIIDVRETNVKPNFIKRIVGGIIDACIVFMVFTGMYILFMNTSMSEKMMNSYDEMIVIQDSYKISSGFGVKEYDFNEETSYRIYTDDQGEEFIVKQITLKENASQNEIDLYYNLYNSYQEKLNKDSAYSIAELNYKLGNFGLVSLSAFIAEAVFYFAIPMIDKKGRTLGKFFTKTMLYSFQKTAQLKFLQLVMLKMVTMVH